MAISEAYLGTGTSIGTSEYSLPNGALYTGSGAITVDGIFQTFIDFGNMTTGDEYQIKFYEKPISIATQKSILQANLVGPQSPPVWVSPSLIFLHGWDITVKRIAGSDRTITWSIRQVA